jgi:hypothetical protein
MERVSPLVRKYVAAVFPADQASALEQLGALREPPAEQSWAELRERVQMAALLLSRGDRAQLDTALPQGAVDWRDLLMGAGLAGSDWLAVLERATRRELPQYEG